MKTKIISVAIILSSLSGCATFSGSHPSKVDNAKQALQNNSASIIENKFLHSFAEDGVNASLGFLETGRFEQLVGNVDTSLNKYSKATAYVTKSEAEAKIRVRNVIKNVQATLLSDKERYYYLSDYEVTFLYAYQSLNYLKMNDLENAAVSIRNLSYAQYATYQTKQLSNTVSRANYSQMRHVNTTKISSEINTSNQYRQLSSIASKINNSYENAFGYYLAAMIYQAYDTDLNNTNLSMQNALSVVPNNSYVKHDAERVKQAFDGAGKLYDNNQGRLVILYENDWVESLQKFDLPIILFFQVAGMQKISLPYYKTYTLGSPASIDVMKSGRSVKKGETEILVDTTAMAAKSLSDRYPAIVTREVLRLITKTAISAAAIQSSGDYTALAAIGTSIYNMATTQADQRSWNLLPQAVSVFSADLDKGVYTVRVNDKLETISIKPYKTMLLWVVKEGGSENILLEQNL
ncbi:hypothetical protein FLM55_03590 [Francisella sp. Scap27]|uniref:COG3014 family protein n=1 Tax=Francisella sp. Scap27 TaxID=2589986 RepID=UPI0015B884D5|nr:hypothetical protein [Francisella sp. Scap27]QLE78870.1 hypothetical protein FLM55_03590 [Francisella sp. Scap27]